MRNATAAVSICLAAHALHCFISVQHFWYLPLSPSFLLSHHVILRLCFLSPLSLSFNIFLSAPSPSHYRSISLSLYFFFPAISLFAAAAVCPNLSHPLHTLSCRSPFLLSPFLPPSFSHLPLILLSVMQDKDTGITYGRVVMALRYLNPLI